MDAPRPLCRDCGHRATRANGRCAACGSPRVLLHDELDRLAIAHLDCDSFYASVEKRDDPTLADKPVIVGGGRRGVVSTCCYVARTFGVRSAMPMFKALELCPDAVVIRPRMEHYADVSREIRTLMNGITPLVEPVSIDEAFLDLTGTDRLHHGSAAEVLAGLARRIATEVGVSVSIGLSYNKFLAKIASDLRKPRGFSVIGEAEAKAFLADKPVTLIPGVGPALADTLKGQGLVTLNQIQAMEETDMMRRFGAHGQWLWRCANGIDRRKVEPDTERKAVSSESSFDVDLTDLAQLSQALWKHCEAVSAALKKKEIAGRTVTLKLRIGRHKGLTRSETLSAPTQLAATIFEVADRMLARAHDGMTPVRLLGVGVSQLEGPDGADPKDLVEPKRNRRADAERAMDKLKGKFGPGSIRTGRGL